MKAEPTTIEKDKSFVLYDDAKVAYYAGKAKQDTYAYMPANKSIFVGTKKKVTDFIAKENITITPELLNSL